jgi:hypothetical protein
MPDNTPDASRHDSNARPSVPVIREANPETIRNIERLLDTAIAVPLAEVSLYVHPGLGNEFHGIDWADLLSDWCAEARHNDEDVKWSRSEVEGDCATHVLYQVTRQEMHRTRSLCSVYVFGAKS